GCVERAAAARTTPGRSVSTTTAQAPSTYSRSGSTGISSSAWSQRGCGTTFAGTRTIRCLDSGGMWVDGVRTAAPAPSTSPRTAGPMSHTNTCSNPAALAARTILVMSGSPATTRVGATDGAPSDADGTTTSS